jgi:hypothetical protein
MASNHGAHHSASGGEEAAAAAAGGGGGGGGGSGAATASLSSSDDALGEVYDHEVADGMPLESFIGYVRYCYAHHRHGGSTACKGWQDDGGLYANIHAHREPTHVFRVWCPVAIEAHAYEHARMH